MVQAMGMCSCVIFSKGVCGFSFGGLTNNGNCKSAEVVKASGVASEGLEIASELCCCILPGKAQSCLRLYEYWYS